MTVQAMVRKCETIRRDASIKDLMKVISKGSSDFVAVVDAQGKACGVVTEKDILKLLKVQPIAGIQTIIIDEIQKRDLEERISAIMTKEPALLRPDSPVKEALEIFLSQDIKRILVADENSTPLGFVSLLDVIKKLAGDL